MLFIADKSAIQAEVKWEIINKDILDGNKKITYISPGGFSFCDDKGRVICFDWQDSGSRIEGKYIISDLLSFDYNYINDSLKYNGSEDLIKDEHRLEFFNNFKQFIEIYCLIDIDGEESNHENNLECVSFELYDPISNTELKLI